MRRVTEKGLALSLLDRAKLIVNLVDQNQTNSTEGWWYHSDALPLFDNRAFSFFQMLSRINQTGDFYFVVTEPHPIDYYFSHFGFLPIFKMSSDESTQQYARILDEDPGNSRADAIRFRADGVAIFSEQGEWVIGADREIDLAAVRSREKILDNDSIVYLMTPDEYSTRLSEIVALRGGTDDKRLT